MLACRDCGIAITRRQHSGYCAACLNRRCARCKAPLPAGRSGYCAACQRNRYQEQIRHPKRTCRGCGTPLPTRRHSHQCAACDRQEYEFRVAVNQRRDRHCADCGCLLTRGRVNNHCQPCKRERLRESLRRRPTGICATCQRPFRRTLAHPVYCSDCAALRHNLWRAYQAGDPVARRLYQPRPRKVRQQKEEPSGYHEKEQN